MTDFQPPANGWRTIPPLSATRPVSVSGSAATFFAANARSKQMFHPVHIQKPQHAAARIMGAPAFALPWLFVAIPGVSLAASSFPRFNPVLMRVRGKAALDAKAARQASAPEEVLP